MPLIIKWTEQANPQQYSNLLGIAWNGSIFCAVGYRNNNVYIVTSTDGETWIEHSPTKNGILYNVAWNGSIFCAVGYGSGDADAYIITSTDGITWVEQTNPQALILTSIVWNGSIFCAVGSEDQSDAYIVTSTDGITWVEQTNPQALTLHDVAWNGSIFCAVGAKDQSDAYIVTSTDGITWVEQTNPQALALSGIAWNGSIFCAVGGGDTDAYIVTSTDGITWVEQTSPQAVYLRGISWNGSIFCAVGDANITNAYIITSHDGETWTERDNPKYAGLYDVTWDGSQFCAVGPDDGIDAYILTSVDIYDIDDSGLGVDSLSIDKDLLLSDSGSGGDNLTFTGTAEEAMGRTRLKPVWLIDIMLKNSGPTLNISDRNIEMYGTIYENYLDDLSGLGAELRRASSQGLNPDIRLNFANGKFRGYNHLVEIGDTYPFEGADITIREIYLDDDDVPSVEVTWFKGVLDEPENIDLMRFECSASGMPFAKDSIWKQDTITKAVYPDADPDDLNKVQNIIYGSCEQVRAHAIKAGAQDSLSEDITEAQVSFQLSDASEFSSGTIVIQCESEQMQGSFSGNTFTATTRGYNSTTAATHDKGMAVFEVLGEYIYLVARHPVSSIGDIYVDGIRQLSGFTKYTGQTGNEHASYPGKAIVVFTAKPIIQKQVNLDADKTGNAFKDSGSAQLLGVVTDDIDFASSATTKQVIPSGAGFGDDPTYAIDGNEVSYALIGGSYDILDIVFPNTSYGTIANQYLHIRRTSTGNVVTVGASYNPTTMANADGWYRFSKSGGTWGETVRLSVVAGEFAQIQEVYKEVEYVPELSKTGGANNGTLDATDNISVTDNIAVALIGNSSADVVVGTSVNCDVGGYRDDASGTYTGTANALIERPDYVFKHFIDVLYGFTLSDIDTASFSAAGSSYAAAISGGYKFGFVINEAITPSKFINDLAFQGRSTIKYEKGLWYLDYLPDAAPAAIKTISKSELAGEFVKFTFSKTSRLDIENDFTAKFKRNYGMQQYDETDWHGTATTSDSASQTKYGAVLPGEYKFPAIRSQAMADHVLAFIKLQKKGALLIVSFPVFWEHFDLKCGDTFDISNDLYNSTIYYIEEIDRADKATLRIAGIQWP